jgi:predicted ribosome quality control (RQC) complex YloA/Tae2 family protein
MIKSTYKEYTIIIGQNQNENDMLVQTSNANDYWIHAGEYPSAHVIISNPTNKRIHNKIIKRACCLLKQHCRKLKYTSRVLFHYTRMYNVTPTDKLGQVLLNNYSVITI